VTRFVCVVALLVVTGCGEESSREGRRPAPQTITEADSGESFTLTSETSLRLSGTYEWSEPRVRGDAVQLVRVDYVQDPGFVEWTVAPVQPGTATIAARGSPACPAQRPCPPPLRFQIEITVPP
jgi:hypothetical protein